MRATSFLNSAVGERGVDALTKAVERLPDLEAVILPRVAMAWLHTASDLGYEGEIPGTEAILKADTISYAGREAVVRDEFLAAVSLLCMAAGCSDLGLPVNLEPRQVARLAKSVDLLTKTRFLKRVRELEKTNESSGDQSATDLEKATDLPGKAAEPRGPQAPTPPGPQQKQAGTKPQQPVQPIGTQGTKKPTT